MHAIPVEQHEARHLPMPNVLLEDALNTEARLLDDLVDVLVRQRSGVAEDDLGVVDDSVFAAQRVFLTLGEARRKRRTLLKLVTGSEDMPLNDLEESLGPSLTDGVRDAGRRLRSSANDLAGELERNRKILRGVIRAGDKLIRALCGGTPPAAGRYAAPGQSTEAGCTIPVDTQV
jgi:hypothetical protein